LDEKKHFTQHTHTHCFCFEGFYQLRREFITTSRGVLRHKELIAASRGVLMQTKFITASRYGAKEWREYKV